MGKTVRYSFLTCTIACLLAAILFIIIFAINGIDCKYIIKDLLTGLTLALSEFTWWGDFYYLAFLVPWISSSLVLILLIYGFDGGVRRRQLLGGLSFFTYYLAMFLAFIIHGLIRGWGDVGYQLFPLWLVGSFGLGYLATTIVERILKLRASD